MAEFLAKNAGVEEAVRKAYHEHDQADSKWQESKTFNAILITIQKADPMNKTADS